MEQNNEYCCGMHEACEKGLIPKPASSIEYYDDEELDVFKERSSDSYSEEEVGQFREVFTTMFVSDVPGWLQSLRSRGIELPDSLKKIVNDMKGCS